MLKASLAASVIAFALATSVASPVFAESYAQELREHPRLVKAMRDLEDAIVYMEKAPHDFGGHKAKAIADSRAALAQLREAIKYRVKVENRR